MVWLQWETAWRVLKKILKIELLYDPEIPPLGLYPKELKAGTQSDICTLMSRAELFPAAKR